MRLFRALFVAPVLAFVLVMAFSNQVYAQLVNPVLEVNATTPVPVGVASYGLYNISQGTGAYQVETSTIVGYSRINALSAYNSVPPGNVSAYGATVQLNTVMNITGMDGKRYSYWLQDVMDLNTSNRTEFLVDNIWNLTGNNANVTNGTITGYGNFSNTTYPGTFSNVSQEFYGYYINSTQFSYPLFFNPVITISMENGHPVVHMGYDQNGTYRFYDNITFNIPARSAYMLVTPYYQSPEPYLSQYNGSYYDAEMVLGGEGSGEVSQFYNSNATVWIGYLNGSTGRIEPFPVVADFGMDTEEAAINLSVEPGNGTARVTNGQLDYNESIRQYGVPAALLKAPANKTAKNTTTAISTTTQNNTSSTVSASNGTQSGQSNSTAAAASGSAGISQYFVPIIAVVAIVLLVALYLMIKAMRNSNASR